MMKYIQKVSTSYYLNKTEVDELNGYVISVLKAEVSNML
jgi:hypothetical protein